MGPNRNTGPFWDTTCPKFGQDCLKFGWVVYCLKFAWNVVGISWNYIEIARSGKIGIWGFFEQPKCWDGMAGWLWDALTSTSLMIWICFLLVHNWALNWAHYTQQMTSVNMSNPPQQRVFILGRFSSHNYFLSFPPQFHSSHWKMWSFFLPDIYLIHIPHLNFIALQSYFHSFHLTNSNQSQKNSQTFHIQGTFF